MTGFIKGLRHRPVSLAFIAQLLAYLALRALDALVGPWLTFYGWLIVMGSLAALLGRALGLPSWWMAINFLLPPAVGYGLQLGLPSWVYLLAFAALAAVFWNSAGDRVPLYLTNKKTWVEILNLIPKDKQIRFVDIGCGLGGLLGYLAEARPESHFHGVETAPLTYLVANWRLGARKRTNLSIARSDLWQEDLGTYDVVYCFLSPAPMEALLQKARREMRPGSLLISNSFLPPSDPPDETMEVADRRKTKLHIWRF